EPAGRDFCGARASSCRHLPIGRIFRTHHRIQFAAGSAVGARRLLLRFLVVLLLPRSLLRRTLLYRRRPPALCVRALWLLFLDCAEGRWRKLALNSSRPP